MTAIWRCSEACAVESLYGWLLPNGISGWSNSQRLMLLFKRHQTLFSLIFPFFSAFSVPSFESFKKSKFQNQIFAEKVRLCWSIARKVQPFLPDGCIALCLCCPCTFPQPDGYIQLSLWATSKVHPFSATTLHYSETISFGPPHSHLSFHTVGDWCSRC